MRHKKFSWAAALIILFSSCIQDSFDSGVLCPSDAASADGRVTFHINIPQSSLPSTRAIAEGSIDDNAVDEVTFLLFTPSTDGTGAYAGSAAATEIETSVSDTKLKTFTVVLPDGEYDALIIANADDAFTAFKTANPGYEAEDRAFFEANLSTIIVGGNATAGYTPWNANPAHAAYKPFPMAARFDIPQVRTSSLGTIFLTRALAKVNVKLAFDQTYAGNRQTIFRLEAVNIPHFNTKGNIIPGNPGTNALSVFNASQLNIPGTGYASSVEKALSYTDIAWMTSNADGVPEQQIIDEIFVPELIKTAGPDNKMCVLIEIWHPTLQANRWYKVNLEMVNPATTAVEPINLLRNFRYTINITDITAKGFPTVEEAYDAAAEGVVAEISAIDESDMNDITFDGRNQLVTNASYFVFQADGPKQDLKVFTDYTRGWKVIANTASSWLTAAPALGTMGVTTYVPLTASANTGATARTGTITIEAGALRKIIEVVQMPALDKIKVDAVTTDKNFNVYVGAFWRANQTGERLIRMPRATVNPQNYDGKWVAVVVSGQDWIQMDTLMTSDTNVGWLTGADEASVDNGGDAGFDRRHQVIGDRNWVSGTMDATDTDIYFRIGLNSHHAATTDKPVRYGMILLAYNNYTKIQRIWIRQGEEADYVMAPGDPGGSGASVVDNRSFAGKFSPYNLSDPNKNTATAYTSASLLPVNGGVFTDYPSQAGYLFTYGDTRAVYPTPAGSTYTNWPTLGSGVWNPDLLETCPPGYRRPTDSGKAAGSEIRQSWWMNPQNGSSANNVENMVSGYYADGWFDRRAIGTSISGTASSVVASPAQNPAYTGADVAYVGVLVYNPAAGSTHYNASMFIPSGGQISTGQIKYTGANAPHWAISSNGAAPGWNSGMNTKSIGLVAYMSLQNINMGLNIRCVRDESLLIPPTLNVTSELADYDYTGGTQTINIESVKGDTPVDWKVTGYDTDGDGLFDDPAPDWLTPPTSSATGTSNVTVKPFAPVSFSYDGVLQRATPKGTASAPHNLSVGADGLAATANCYIVDAPGSYQLLLAYGNGINHGVDNPSAYKATVSGENVLSNMVRSDGVPANPIIGGLIADNTDLTTQPTGATLVWQDAPDLVSNLRLDATNTYLQFDVAQGSIKQGNAIVAVVSGSAILWSWHIWVTPMKMMEPTDAPIVNSTGTAFYMMNYNLGWMEDPATNYGAGTYGDQGRTVEVRIEQTGVGKPANATFTVTQTAHSIRNGGRGCYYQWGRKDPMPADGVTVNTSTASYAYTFRGEIVVMSVLRTIARPFFFINGSGLGGAYGYDADENNNYWDNSNALSGAATASLTSSVKTVVDPSPIGWKVAPAAAFTGFSTTTGGAFNGGWNFYRNPGNPQQGTINFPAGGYRDGSSAGSITEVGTAGRYWTAHPYSDGIYSVQEGSFTARYMDFGSGYVTPRQAIEGADGFRSNGFSVRPVRE